MHHSTVERTCESDARTCCANNNNLKYSDHSQEVSDSCKLSISFPYWLRCNMTKGTAPTVEGHRNVVYGVSRKYIMLMVSNMVQDVSVKAGHRYIRQEKRKESNNLIRLFGKEKIQVNLKVEKIYTIVPLTTEAGEVTLKTINRSNDHRRTGRSEDRTREI